MSRTGLEASLDEETSGDPDGASSHVAAARSIRRRAGVRGEIFVRLSAVAGLGAATVTAAWLQADRAAAPATAWLGLVATAVAAALLVTVRRALLPVAFAMVLALLVAVYLPRAGAAPLATMAALLASALVVAAAELGTRRTAGDALPWLGVALAAQVIVHADRLWLEPFSATVAAAIVGLPAAASVALAVIARCGGAGLALAAGGAALAAGPGFTLATVAGLAVGAVLSRWRPAWSQSAPLLAAVAAFAHEPPWAASALLGLAAAAGSPVSAAARAARGALAFVTLGALLAAAAPWQRTEPVATLLRVACGPPLRGLEELLSPGSRALSAGAPAVTWHLSGAPVRALVIDSFLTDGAELECGSAVARVRVGTGHGEPLERWLTVGQGTGEWASSRPDVAARLACRELVPHSLWLPSAGRFFGRTFRARWLLDVPVAAESVEIERLPGLPAEVRLHLQRVAAER